MPVPLLIGLAVAGSATKAIGASQQADAQASADSFNASVKGQQAVQAEQQATEEARMSRVSSARFIGQQKANYGASGVSGGSGSAMDVLQSSAANAELDALNTQHKGDMQAWSLQQGQALDNYSGANAHEAGNLAVAGDIFGGATQAAGMMK